MSLYVKPTTKLSEHQKKEMLERELMKRSRQEQQQLGQAPGMPQSPMQSPQTNQGLLSPQFQQGGLLDQQIEGTRQATPDLQPGDLKNAKRLDSATVVVPPATEMHAWATIAAQLWKDMGGNNSLGGHLWSMFLDKKDTHHASARDYFISQFVKWQVDPKNFEKRDSREAKLFTELWSKFTDSLSPKKQGLVEQLGLPPDPRGDQNEQGAAAGQAIPGGGNGLLAGAGLEPGAGVGNSG